MAKVTTEKKNTSNKAKKSVSQVETSNTPEPVHVVQELAPEPVPEHEPVVESVTQFVESSTAVEESNTEILFNKLVNQFQDIQTVMKTLSCNLKILQKEVLRERKESKKKESKIKKKSDKKKSPSGFAKPAPISADLADFLGLSSSDIIARTDVTSKVIAYVKEHNLQNPENKKQIIPDAKLKALLQPGDSEVNFFNLQTHLKKHFPQSIASTTATTTTLEASVV